MKWVRLVAFTLIVWAGTVITSVLVAEWREPDLDPLKEDLRSLQEYVGRDVGTVPGFPQPYLSPTNPPPDQKAELREGESVTLDGGGSFTVDQIEGKVITFILEGPNIFNVGTFTKAVDVEGFLCPVGSRGIYSHQLAEGEKVEVVFVPNCEGRELDWLQVDGMLFEVP